MRTASPERLQVDERLALEKLLQWGLITSEAVVDGSARVSPMHSRNANYRVVTSTDSFFVKQGDFETDADRPGVQRESMTLQTIQRERALAAVADRSPRLVHHDSRNVVLVTDLVEGTSLWAASRGGGAEMSSSLAEAGHQLGMLLAELHTLGRDTVDRVTSELRLPHRRPWFLDIANQERHTHGTAAEIGRLVAQHEVSHALEWVDDQWDDSALIHGDVKAENLIVGAEGVFLLDWEAFDRGDPRWDVACCLHSTLAMWIASMPAGSSASSAELIDQAGLDLDTLAVFAQSFWDTYRRSVLDPCELRDLMRFVAARLVQGAAEHSSEDLSPTGRLLLQLARNTWDQPMEAARQLLGLGV